MPVHSMTLVDGFVMAFERSTVEIQRVVTVILILGLGALKKLA